MFTIVAKTRPLRTNQALSSLVVNWTEFQLDATQVSEPDIVEDRRWLKSDSLTRQPFRRRGGKKRRRRTPNGRDKGMPINLKSPKLRELKPRVMVCGVGGAGGNAVNNMIVTGLSGVDFVVAKRSSARPPRGRSCAQ